MKHRILLPLALVLTLGACETVDGIKRDSSTLWNKMGFSAEKTEENAAPETDSLAAPVASNCPAIEIMPELKTLTEFTHPAKPSDKSKISEFTMVGVQSECKQHKAALAMHIDVLFTGKIGPKAKTGKADKPNFAYPYFIAVTDEAGAVVAKEIFAASVSYAADQTDVKQIESITQTLPVKSAEDLGKFRVLVGFQLDEDQLAYNRTQLSSSAGETAQ